MRQQALFNRCVSNFRERSVALRGETSGSNPVVGFFWRRFGAVSLPNKQPSRHIIDNTIRSFFTNCQSSRAIGIFPRHRSGEGGQAKITKIAGF